MSLKMRETAYTKKKCRQKIYYAKTKILNPGIGDSSKRSYLGAQNELLVCAAYLKKGYEVFQATHTNAECDLIVFKRGHRPLRIEVKTGYYNVAGTRGYSPVNFANMFDILAVVYYDGRIEYYPRSWVLRSKKT